jgi:hypothetical protein
MPLDAVLSELIEIAVTQTRQTARPSRSQAFHSERESWYAEAVWDGPQKRPPTARVPDEPIDCGKFLKVSVIVDCPHSHHLAVSSLFVN